MTFPTGNMGMYILLCPETFQCKKTAKNGKNRIFGDLGNYFCDCAHIICVRGLIFLLHLQIRWINLHSKGQPPSTFLTGATALQRQGTKKITKMAGKNPFFEVAQNRLELLQTIKLTIIPPILVVIACSQLALAPKQSFFGLI